MRLASAEDGASGTGTVSGADTSASDLASAETSNTHDKSIHRTYIVICLCLSAISGKGRLSLASGVLATFRARAQEGERSSRGAQTSESSSLDQRVTLGSIIVLRSRGKNHWQPAKQLRQLSAWPSVITVSRLQRSDLRRSRHIFPASWAEFRTIDKLKPSIHHEVPSRSLFRTMKLLIRRS